MNKKLYVGNLNYDTTEERLRSLFSEVGPVDSVTVITDRETGRSKGFGFVEMGTEEAAEAAIGRLNDTEVDRRTIVVSEARPPRDRSYGSGGGGPRRRGNGGRGGSRGRGEMY